MDDDCNITGHSVLVNDEEIISIDNKRPVSRKNVSRMIEVSALEFLPLHFTHQFTILPL